VHVLADFEAQAVVFDLELRQLVLANEVEDLFDLIQVHAANLNPQISMSSVVTSVRTSTPLSVTSTSSSMRTPPHPARYAPGSMVKTIPETSATGCMSARGLPMRGSS